MSGGKNKRGQIVTFSWGNLTSVHGLLSILDFFFFLGNYLPSILIPSEHFPDVRISLCL